MDTDRQYNFVLDADGISKSDKEELRKTQGIGPSANMHLEVLSPS